MRANICPQTMADEGIHEIQLNGKQLVFLFMASTVVFVVVFLCGVMVGRGVRPSASAAASQQDALDPTASLDGIDSDRSATAPPPPSATSTGSAAANEELSYPNRLEDSGTAPETLVEPVDIPPDREPAPTARSEAASKPAAATPTADASRSMPEPPGNGFVVQVAAVRERTEADTIARRLSSKGYPSFVTTSGANVFRVRVGKYADRRQAETIKNRLEKEEQFKPWVTR